jgi:hypothetical protein
MPFVEFHLPNIFNWFGPSLTLNLYILGNMILLNAAFILGAVCIILYVRRFYGQRPIPQAWKIFWWALILYCFHEFWEAVGAWQLVVGQVYPLLLSLAEISSIILLTWGAYLLVKTYVER